MGQLLPYPHIIEEVAKLGLIWFLVNIERSSYKQLWLFVALAAAFFTLSESILYLNNLFLVGQLDLFLTRIVFTGLLHLITMYVMYAGFKIRYAVLPALFFAIALHYLYNQVLVYMLF